MGRRLTREDVAPAMLGGLLLSAGGSGTAGSLERHDVAAEIALSYAAVDLCTLDELPGDGWLLVSTSVGAPGFARPELVLRDHVDAAQALIDRLGSAPVGVICGHVPGFNGWLVAAALGLPYVDAAANGRGHPTVKMGGMGLASRPTERIVQVAQAGFADSGSRISVIAEGNLSKTSQVMRHTAAISGGLVASARGPYGVDFVRRNGATGAVSFQIALGHSMLAADPGPARIAAAARAMSGEVLVTGTVTENSVAYRDGFDIGRLVVESDGARVELGVFNEYMTADRNGTRVATFPDMIGSMVPETGDPVALSILKPGDPVAIVSGHRSGFPLGKGALDPAVFTEIEDGLGLDLFSYVKEDAQ